MRSFAPDGCAGYTHGVHLIPVHATMVRAVHFIEHAFHHNNDNFKMIGRGNPVGDCLVVHLFDPLQWRKLTIHKRKGNVHHSREEKSSARREGAVMARSGMREEQGDRHSQTQTHTHF